MIVERGWPGCLLSSSSNASAAYSAAHPKSLTGCSDCYVCTLCLLGQAVLAWAAGASTFSRTLSKRVPRAQGAHTHTHTHKRLLRFAVAAHYGYGRVACLWVRQRARNAVHDAEGGVYGAMAQRQLVFHPVCNGSQSHQHAQSAAGRRHQLGEPRCRLH